MSTCHLCNEQVPPDEIMDHIRLFHPGEYGDGPTGEMVDMTDDGEPEGIEVARITIVRRLTNDDSIDFVEALDGSGNDLPLTEALGMLRLAEDTLIRERMGDE